MIITNFKDLAKNSLREKALLIAEAGYEAIEIEKAVKGRIKVENNFLKIITYPAIVGDIRQEELQQKNQVKINLNDFQRIFMFGIGKGSALASATLAKILGEKLTGGIALDVSKVKSQKSKVKCFIGTHPLPSEINIEATLGIIKLAESLKEGDLLINFICGGGSALTCVSKEELKNSSIIFQRLTKAGATIKELNMVRKHLSKLKGGGLAKMACNASRVISLIVSDVCGNDLSVVSSGPTVFDKTTKEDAEDILKKYGLDAKDFHLYETPKEKECFKNVENILFVCNQDAVMAMAEKARELGFEAKIYSLAFQGEAMDVLSPMVEYSGTNTRINTNDANDYMAILAAGETTVTLKGRLKGKGGRNTEAVLGAISNFQSSKISKFKDVVIMSFTSDGRDNSEAAGAIGDALTLQKAEKLGINAEEFLRQNRSFDFFDKTEDLIFVEQKCFNVADLMLVLKVPIKTYKSC